MGFSKGFFPPIKVLPQGHGFFLIIIKVFSPRGVFPKGSADRRPRKGHRPRQAPEKAKGFPKSRFFPEQDEEMTSDSTNNERTAE